MLPRQRARRLMILVAGLAILDGQAARAPALPEISATSVPWTMPPLQLAASSDLVQTDVTVRDSHGHAIPGLLKDNFVLEEDGKPQPLTYFSVIAGHGATAGPARPVAAAADAAAPEAAAPPRYIGLYFDDVSSSASDLNLARNAALRMLHTGLGPGDHICVFTASGTQALDCTRDTAGVELTLGRIHVHPTSGGLTIPCPRITDYEAAQIVLYNNTFILNAVTQEAKQCTDMPTDIQEFLAAELQSVWFNERATNATILNSLRHATDYLAHQLGQRVLLLASDGFTDDDLDDAVQAILQDALHNDVVINALESKGLYTIDAGGRTLTELNDYDAPLNSQTYIAEEELHLADEQDHEEVLASLAQGTGGYFFSNSNDLTRGFQQLASTPPIVYQLGFALNVPRDGKYHKLKVALAPAIKNATVQARAGYFAPQPGITVGDFLTAMDNAMRDAAVQSAVPATVGIKALHQEVDVVANFDAAKLPFLKHLGREDQKLFLTAALFDSQGNLAEGKRGELDLWLLPATRQRFNSEGVQARLALYTARPGSYRLRVVVGESSDAKLSTFSQNIQVH